MRLQLGILFFALAGSAAAQQPGIVLRPGLIITHSARVVPRTYQLQANDRDSAVIIVRGSHITLDFAGATLLGSAPGADPDAGRGVAIRIEGGSDVVIKNARVHGYKVAVLASGTRQLSLLDNDFSRNWHPRLFSIVEHESLVDWLSHHHNEKDEWLRFGAAVYLRDVHGGELRGNRIEHGMEGIMLVRSDSLRIWNNIIQFNSGVGISLYRSSSNTIMHNYASFNVRGFSQGFYRRGQDSADLLLYEQSSHNVVAYNSMTHGGDGLFLWAGQQTMDTGEGGSNDNLFLKNDFSYAPTNAMEATFSRNAFIMNRAFGSEYGLWGGYSYDSDIDSNQFGENRIGIAIEHGQNNKVIGNHFDGDSTAISLWGVPEQPSDWGYPKHRDTRSRDYQIGGNWFKGNRVALRVANSLGVRYSQEQNRYERVDSPLVVRDTMTRVVPLPRSGSTPDHAWPSRMRGGLDPSADPLAKLPRAAIIVDEWGPYDWRTPKLWPADSSRRTPLPLRVLGPAGTWRVIATKGVARTSSNHGKMNDTIVVTPEPLEDRNWRITLKDDRGRTFSYERFEPIRSWSVDFMTKQGAFLMHRDEPRLDYMGYHPKGLPQDSFKIVATASVVLPTDTYTLRSISDDGIRVYVDDKLVIDNWTPHESLVDNAPIAPGKHQLRVEYQQVDGWMELRVEIVKRVQRSTGSPPPH